MDRDKITDEKLILDYIKGDDEAFTELVNRYIKPVYNFIYRFCRNKSDTEEAVQESFVKLWKNIRKFKRNEKFKVWFYSIARNTAIDFLRKRKNIPFSEFENEEGENVLENTYRSEEPDAYEEFEKFENKEIIEGLLENLPVLYKEVLFLYYNEELTLEETSKILKKPLNTIKSLHRRGLMLLRKRLSATK